MLLLVQIGAPHGDLRAAERPAERPAERSVKRSSGIGLFWQRIRRTIGRLYHWHFKRLAALISSMGRLKKFNNTLDYRRLHNSSPFADTVPSLALQRTRLLCAIIGKLLRLSRQMNCVIMHLDRFGFLHIMGRFCMCNAWFTALADSARYFPWSLQLANADYHRMLVDLWRSQVGSAVRNVRHLRTPIQLDRFESEYYR